MRPSRVTRMLSGLRSRWTMVVRSHVVELADIRMIERGDGAGFTLEAFREPFVRGLDRDDAIEAHVASPVHLSQPPAPINARIS
jgi:hypothetical protein